MKLTRFILLSAFAASFLSADKIGFEFIGKPDFRSAPFYKDYPPRFMLVITYYNSIYEEEIYNNVAVITSKELLSENIENNLQEDLDFLGEKDISAIQLHNILFRELIVPLSYLYDSYSKKQLSKDGRIYVGHFDLTNFETDENNVYVIDEVKIDREIKAGLTDRLLKIEVMAFNIYRKLQDLQHFGAQFDGKLTDVDDYEPRIKNLINLTKKFYGIPHIPETLEKSESLSEQWYIPEPQEEPVVEEFIQEEPVVEEESFSLQRSIASLLTRFKTRLLIGGGISVGIVAVTLLYKLVPYIQTMELFKQSSSQ